MDATTRRRFTHELGKRVDDIADRVTDEASRELPDLANPVIQSAFRDSVVSNVELFRDFVDSDGDKRTVRSSPQAKQMARTLAVRGLPLSTLVVLFHRAQNLFESQLLNIARDVFVDYDSAKLVTVLTELRKLTNSYAATRTEQLPGIFAEASARLQVPGDPKLLAHVQKVLRDGEETSSIGGHRVDGPQLSFLLWGDAVTHASPDAMLRAGKEIAALAGASDEPLLVFSSPRLLWGWCRPEDSAANRGGRGAALVDPDRLAGVLPDEASVAVGPVLDDLNGFRRSHQIAQRLRRVAEGDPAARRRAIDAGMDGALTAASFVDRMPLAAEIVSATLGEFAGEDEYASVIRETVRNFLRHGIAGTAEQMVTHRNTVKYRLDKFRDALGKDTETAADVRLALELAHWLGPEILPGGRPAGAGKPRHTS